MTTEMLVEVKGASGGKGRMLRGNRIREEKWEIVKTDSIDIELYYFFTEKLVGYRW